MPAQKIREFGRRILVVYEKHPLLANCIVGGTVYVAGEITIQSRKIPSLQDFNWKKISSIGLLGSFENGILALSWYVIMLFFFRLLINL